MKALRTASDWLELWFLWFLVTGACWSVGLVIAVVIASSASLALSSQVSLLLGGIVVGALIGLVQQEILRPDVRGVGVWTLATAIGWTAGLVVTSTVVRMAEPTPGWLIGGVLGGFVWGLAQLPVLRSETGGRGGWLLLTVLGWTAALALGMALPVRPKPGAVGGEVVEVATSGAMGLVIIGMFAILALTLLFPEPHPRAVDRNVRWWP
jgi:hypothetical protein